jgi:putative glutamine amidotransferase
MKRALPGITMLLLLLVRLPAEAVRIPVIAMCQPTVKQIRNLVELYERDLIPLPRIELVGVYHADEETDYRPAREYVRAQGLDWIRFRAITGAVAPSEVYGENAWTPQFRELFAEIDGLIMTGGADIPPPLYGKETALLTEPDEAPRNYYEISLLFHLLGGGRNPAWKPWLAERPDFPILAICLGMQSLNVACGGTLLQDIPSDVYGLHTAEAVLRRPPAEIHSSVYLKKVFPTDDNLPPAFHPIQLGKESRFVREMGMKAGDRPWVLTAHHQAVDRIGAGLRPAARSLDGRIVEALEHETFGNVLGVQFHPEPYILYQKGAFFRGAPDGEPTFNPRAFLESRPPSMDFYGRLWRWFSEQVEKRAAR